MSTKHWLLLGASVLPWWHLSVREVIGLPQHFLSKIVAGLVNVKEILCSPYRNVFLLLYIPFS